MAAVESKSWLRVRAEKALVKGLTRAYSTVQVDRTRFLVQLRTAYRLPISGYLGTYSLDVGELDVVADDLIRGGMKLAAAEGAGFGLGGLITIIPDLGILSAITMRTIQKLSLVYGFQFNTDSEIAELWIAAASAAGVEVRAAPIRCGVAVSLTAQTCQSEAIHSPDACARTVAEANVPIEGLDRCMATQGIDEV